MVFYNITDTSLPDVFKALEPATEIILKATGEYNNRVVLFFAISKTGDIIKLRDDDNDELLLLNINKLADNEYGITGIDIETDIDSIDDNIVDIEDIALSPKKEEIAEEEDIIEDKIEILTEETIVEKEIVYTIEYTFDELQKQLEQDLLDYATITNKTKDPFHISNAALSWLDLVEQTRAYDVVDGGIVFKTDVLRSTDHYSPLLRNIERGIFTPLILPIVYDKKRIYENKEDTTDMSYISDEQAIRIERREDKISYNEYISKINALSRAYTNLSPEELSYYELKNQYLTNVVSWKETKKNEYDFKPYYTNDNIINFDIRKAIGNEYIFKDVLSDKLISDSKGKIKICGGTNKGAELSYTENAPELEQSMVAPPRAEIVSDGEEMYIVGFYIRSNKHSGNNVIFGQEYYRGDMDIPLYTSRSDDVKYYPPIYNRGISLANQKEAYMSKNVKVIGRYTDFTWLDYNDSFDYMVFFNVNDPNTKQFLDDEKRTLMDSILPTVQDILHIENDNLSSCDNIIDVQKILNKYHMDVRNITIGNAKKYGIFDKITKSILQEYKLQNFLSNQYNNSLYTLTDYNSIYNVLENYANTINILYREDTKAKTKDLNKFCKTTLHKYTDEFLKELLYFVGINNNKNEVRDDLITKITNYFLTKVYTNVFTEFIFDKNTVFSRQNYITQLDKLLQLHNLNIDNFTRETYGHYNQTELKAMDFIRKLTKTLYSGSDILNVFNEQNKYNNFATIQNLIDVYGERNYNTQVNIVNRKDLPTWNELTDEERKKYNPSKEEVDNLKTELYTIKQSYEYSRHRYKHYLDKCAGIQISKRYVSIESLRADNFSVIGNPERDIYWDKKLPSGEVLDTTITDVNLYKNYLKERVNNDPDSSKLKSLFIKRILSINYPFDTDVELDNKYMNILENLERPIGRKVKEEDIAVLDTQNKRILYHRIKNTWIPVDHVTLQGLNRCYNYDRQFLNVPFNEIEQMCNNVEFYDITENDKLNTRDAACVDLESKTIVRKLRDIVIYSRYLEKRIETLNMLLTHIEKNDKTKEQLHLSFTKLEELRNKKSRSRFNIALLPRDTNVYPPSHLRNELNKIRKEEDADILLTNLRDFVNKYGSLYNRNKVGAIEIKGQSLKDKLKNAIKTAINNVSTQQSQDIEIEDETSLENMSEDKYYYWDIPTVTVPLLCKHYSKLFLTPYKDNEYKSGILEEVIQVWGIPISGSYVCKNCGETIDYLKLSTYEGFGLSQFREKDVDTTLQNDAITALLTDDQLLTKYILDGIINGIHVNLTDIDLKFILEKTNGYYESTLLSLDEYYQTTYKKLTKISPIVSKQEEVFIKRYGEITTETLIKSSKDNEVKQFQEIFFVRQDKSGKPLLGVATEYYNGYKSLMRLKYLFSIMIFTLVTSVPEYYIKGTGVERKKGGLLLNNLYPNREQVIIYITNMLDEQLKAAKSSSDKSIAGQVNRIYFATELYFKILKKDKMPTNILDQIKEAFNEISLGSEFVERINQKENELKRIEEERQQVNAYGDYKWYEFLPPLYMTTKIPELAIPNLEDYFDAYNQLKEKLSRTKSGTSSAISTTNKMNNIISELAVIHNNLSFILIAKINHIVGTQGEVIYDNVSEDYITYYMKKDADIKVIMDTLDAIHLFRKNIAFEAKINVFSYQKYNSKERDLQSYMYIDSTMYSTEEEYKKQLINKIKQINYLYNPVTKKKRYFREIKDTDYDIVISILEDNPDIDDAALKEELQKRLISKYKTDDIDFEFKNKILLENNGVAIIDVISGEFLKDIDKIINEQVIGKTVFDIKRLITGYEIERDLLGIVYKNPNAMIELMEYKSKLQLDKDNIENIMNGFLEYYTLICGTEYDVKNVVSKLNTIQKRITEYSNTVEDKGFDENREKTYYRELLNLYGDVFDECYNSKLDELIEYMRTYYQKKASEVAEQFNKLGQLDNYYNEIRSEIRDQLKIEGFKLEDIEDEEYFRNLIIKENQATQRFILQKQIISYILLILNRLESRTYTQRKLKTKKGKESNDEVKGRVINYTIVSSKADIGNVSTLIETYQNKINNQIENLEENVSKYRIDMEAIYTKINPLLETIKSFENDINKEGKTKMIYMSNPVFLNKLTRFIIVSLMAILLDEEIIEYVKPIMGILYEYIQKVNIINNYTDVDTFEVIKKQRTKESEQRKKKFDNLPKDRQALHKLRRTLGLGKMVEGEEDITDFLNEEEFLKETDELGFEKGSNDEKGRIEADGVVGVADPDPEYDSAEEEVDYGEVE